MAVGLAIIALSLAGVSGLRVLEVPPAKSWGHAATGLILPPTLVGLARREIGDLGTGEFDIAAQYGPAGGAEEITVYLFRPGTPGVPLWFDRSEIAIETRDGYGTATPAIPAPIAFARSGSGPADSLRRVYLPAKGGYRTTGVAVMPLGDWIVAIRYSAATLDAATLDGKIAAAAAAIRFPSGATAGPAAVPITACTGTVRYHHARPLPNDMAQMLLSSIVPPAVAAKEEKEIKPLPAWCREGTPRVAFNVYRVPGDPDGYMIAFNDAGRTMDVSPEVALLTKRHGYTVTFNDLDSRSVYPSFDKLPEPDQVAGLPDAQRPASVSRGKTISITMPPGK